MEKGCWTSHSYTKLNLKGYRVRVLLTAQHMQDFYCIPQSLPLISIENMGQHSVSLSSCSHTDLQPIQRCCHLKHYPLLLYHIKNGSSKRFRTFCVFIYLFFEYYIFIFRFYIFFYFFYSFKNFNFCFVFFFLQKSVETS